LKPKGKQKTARRGKRVHENTRRAKAAAGTPAAELLAGKVLRVLLGILRENHVRRKLCRATGASHEALDAALLSAEVQQPLGIASAATVTELNVDLLAEIYKHARKQQSAPLRLVAEHTPLREGMSAAARSMPPGALALDPFEQAVVEGVVAALRARTREPAVHASAAPPLTRAEQDAADSSASGAGDEPSSSASGF
jgi:hypothetical protein